MPTTDTGRFATKFAFVTGAGSGTGRAAALVGVVPAVANAVYHATGKRIRDLPITPDKLL